VYFLVLVIRRVLLFHGLLATHAADARLSAARSEFQEAAPQAKTFWAMYEQVGEYLFDQPGKRVNLPGRPSPILKSRWDWDNVVIALGNMEMDVTPAAVAALTLARRASRSGTITWTPPTARDRDKMFRRHRTVRSLTRSKSRSASRR
jgi:hypothetical protein